MNFFKKYLSWNKSEKQQKNEKRKIGLALSGGGARGYGHIGALKAFEELGIDFDVVAGTSVGSLVGALYCYGFSADEMLEMALNLKIKDIRTSKIVFVPSKTNKLEEYIISLMGDIDIKDLKKTFCAVAVDMISGEEIVFTEGRLCKILAGSCAVPVVFECVQYENMNLMDGGLANTIPADIPKMLGCDKVIAIDINKARGRGTDSTKTIDLLMASIRILMKSNCVKGKLNSDILIEPDLKDFKSTRLDGAEEMIEEGYRAVMERKDEILQIFNPVTIENHPKKTKKIKEKKKKYNKKQILDIEQEIEVFDSKLNWGKNGKKQKED